MPLITGGTAYYFKQLIYGPSKTPAADMEIRKKVNSLIEERGSDWAYEELDRVDHTAAQRIYRNDIYRISRALEVYYQTGIPLSSFEVSDSFRDDIDFLVIGLVRDKSILDERIEKRVDIMFDMGLYDEAAYDQVVMSAGYIDGEQYLVPILYNVSGMIQGKYPEFDENIGWVGKGVTAADYAKESLSFEGFMKKLMAAGGIASP